MINNQLTKKLGSYSALGTTFLALAPHTAEAQIIYCNIPDQQICAYQEIDNDSIYAYRTDFRYIQLDLDQFKLTTSSRINGVGSFQKKPGVDVLFIANVWVMDNDPYVPDNQAHAYVYGFSNSGAGVSNFMGTSANGFIRRMHPGEWVGPDVQRATNHWGAMPGISRKTDGAGAIVSEQVVNPAFISDNSNPTKAYVGVAFDINQKTHYGWIQLLIEQDVEVLTADAPGKHRAKSCITVLDFAYSTLPETAIKVGVGSSGVNVIPTMTEWGMFGSLLFLLSMGTVLLLQKESGTTVNLVGTNTHILRFQAMPFSRVHFFRALLFAGLFSIPTIAGILGITGTFTPVDLFGMLATFPIFSYWLHLLLWMEKK